MEPDDALYRTFLEELHGLEDFRLGYGLDHPEAGLEREDPDVKRLIEALALFGARTQLAALRNVDATRRRLYQQFFPYLLTPLPAMGMARAKPTGHLAETLSLPAGTELAFLPDAGGTLLFRTVRPLRVLPLRIDAVKQELRPGAGARLLLAFRTAYPLNEDIGTLSLHIDYLNDFGISLRVFHFLERELNRVGVHFGEYAPDQAGTECGFRLGVPPPDLETDDWSHPLEAERLYFHYPQQELYLEVDVPSPPRNWSGFTLVLDFARPWPPRFQPNRELFQLFATPVANSLRAFAQPVSCDGTQERHTIRHPQPELGFALQKVLGVYELREQGMAPLRPGILAGGNGSYEIELAPASGEGGQLYRLVPHFPEAFEHPRTLAVEALWLQPRADRLLQQNHRLQPFRRQTAGVQWELLGTPVPPADNRHLDNTSAYLHLLTLMHKPCLSRQDLQDLLSALGSVAAGRFQPVFRGMDDVRLEEQPLTGTDRRSTRQIYHLRFKRSLEDSGYLVETFVRHVGRVLDHWISEAPVEARAEFPDATDGAAEAGGR